VGEIGQARIALSKARGTSLIRRVVDDDNLERVGREVLVYQGFDGRRQQVISVVGADNRREGDLTPFRRGQDGRAGGAIRIGGRHEGRCSYLTATMLKRFERFPTADVEMQTLFGGVLALHLVPPPLPRG